MLQLYNITVARQTLWSYNTKAVTPVLVRIFLRTALVTLVDSFRVLCDVNFRN